MTFYGQTFCNSRAGTFIDDEFHLEGAKGMKKLLSNTSFANSKQALMSSSVI